MKSALVILLPCLVAISLPHVARAQILSTLVNQFIQTAIDAVGLPLSGSCPEVDNLSEECKRQFLGGLGSSAFAICTGECYEPVLAAYESCEDMKVFGASFLVDLLRAGESKFMSCIFKLRVLHPFPCLSHSHCPYPPD